MHQQALYPLPKDTTIANNYSNSNHTNSNHTNTNNHHTAGKRNLFADFVCQMLPTATNTCRYLDEETSDGDFTKRVNVNIHDQKEHTVSIQDMHRIRQMAKYRGESIRDAPSHPKVPSRIVARWFRTQEKRNNGTIHHLKRCLEKGTLDTLKRVSWEFLLQQMRLVQRHNTERRLRRSSSELFRSSRSTSHLLFSSQHQGDEGEEEARGHHQPHENEIEIDSEESFLNARAKINHDASFDEYFATGVFCEIDVERLFHIEDFVKYVLV
jgi:hypothetical protein